MWIFHKKRHELELNKKEAQIQAIRSDTLKAIDNASEKAEKLNDLMENDSLSKLVTLAMGGERRGR